MSSILNMYPALSQIPLLSAAPVSHIDRYLTEDCTTKRNFLAGDRIYSSETLPISVGVVLSGRAEIYTSESEEGTLLKVISPQDMFGIANLYAADTAFPTVIRATDVCEVLFFDGDAFRAFIENDPTVLRLYLHFLSKKIVYLNRKIATFTAPSAEKKLGLFLLENHANGCYQGSMTKLAELLGIGRASLYRSIDKLCAQGLINHEGSTLILCDPSALLDYSQNA